MMKKIVLKSPPEQEKMVMLFPVIQNLVNEFGPECQISIIANEGLSNIFEFLPHQCSFYTFPKEKDSLTGIHHYCYNLNDIFNVDIYFDFENTYKSAFMGFAFRAHERYGVKTGMNKMFLTHQVVPDRSDLYDSYYMSYYSTMGGKPIHMKSQEYDNVIALPTQENKPSPIVVIMTEDHKVLWKDFFDCFIDQEFLIWNEGNLSLEEEQKNWDSRNKYQIFLGINYQKVKELLIEYPRVVSDSYLLTSIASYLNCDAFVFSKSSVNLPYYEYMPKQPIVVKTENNSPVKICLGNENIQIERMDQFVDKLVEKFKI